MKKLILLLFLLPIILLGREQNGIYITNSELAKQDVRIIYDEINIKLENVKFKNKNPELIFNIYANNSKYEILKFSELEVIKEDKIFLIESNENKLIVNKELLNSENIAMLESKKSVLYKNEYFISNQIKNKNETSLLNDNVKFSSFFGNNKYNLIRSVITDKEGNVYFGGETESADLILPNLNLNVGGFAQMIIKTSPDLDVNWITLIGGSNKESIFDITLDENNNIWAVGETQSMDYLITENAVQKEYAGGFADGAVYSLDHTGNLIYASYYGTEHYEALLGIECFNGKIYTAGQTAESKGFYMIFDRNGYVYTEGFYGQEGYNSTEDIAVDSLGNLYLTGWLNSNLNVDYNLNEFSGDYDSYVAKLNINTFEFDKLVYIGGKNREQSYNIEIDKLQNIYVTGSTTSNSILANKANSNSNGNQDYFLAKINPSFDIEWINLIGGSKNEGMTGPDSYQGGLAIKDSIIFIGTQTNSNDVMMYKSLNEQLKGDFDVLIQAYDINGKLNFSTYYGGSKFEINYALYIDNDFNIYSVGGTKSDDFPITENAIQNQFGGNMDAFILKFNIGNIFEPIPEPKPINCSGELYNYSGFANLRGLKPIGYSQKRDSTLWLTDNSEYNKGAIWTEIPYDISQGFTSEFVFQLSEGSDLGHFDGFAEGGDGLAFVIQATGNDVLGFEGGGLAYEGIPNAIAIELDLYQNDEPGFNDPNGNHISIFGSKDNISANHWSDDLIFENTNIEEIKIDNSKYKFKVVFNSVENSLEVYLNKNNEEQKSVAFIDNFDIKQYIDLIDETGVHFGITASTGNAVQIHKLNSWYYCVGSEIEDAIAIKDNFAYPNPINDVFRIKEGVPYEKVILHDFVGNYYELISTTNAFDVSNLAKGIYIIEIINGNSISHQKIIVQ